MLRFFRSDRVQPISKEFNNGGIEHRQIRPVRVIESWTISTEGSITAEVSVNWTYCYVLLYPGAYMHHQMHVCLRA